MAGEFVGVEIAGLEDLMVKLNKLPEVVQDHAIDEANKYMLNVLKLYPPYSYVPFNQAYGKWFSEKQRRYVMARIAEGSITPGMPNRSQRFANNWKVVGYGRNSIIANETPYGPYLVGDNTQARMPAKIGWKKLSATIKQRMAQIISKAEAGVKKAIRILGL